MSMKRHYSDRRTVYVPEHSVLACSPKNFLQRARAVYTVSMLADQHKSEMICSQRVNKKNGTETTETLSYHTGPLASTGP